MKTLVEMFPALTLIEDPFYPQLKTIADANLSHCYLDDMNSLIEFETLGHILTIQGGYSKGNLPKFVGIVHSRNEGQICTTPEFDFANLALEALALALVNGIPEDVMQTPPRRESKSADSAWTEFKEFVAMIATNAEYQSSVERVFRHYNEHQNVLKSHMGKHIIKYMNLALTGSDFHFKRVAFNKLCLLFKIKVKTSQIGTIDG